jgi:hypothetical protein
MSKKPSPPSNPRLQRTRATRSPLSRQPLGDAILLLALLTAACGVKGPELAQPYMNPAVRDRVIASVPQPWSLVETKEDQVPWGHHWSDGYKGHGGTKLVLVGPSPVNFHWRDQAGQWHDDPIAHETLEIWILPAEYREGRYGFHDPIPPDLVSATHTVRVYARPSHRLNSESEFEGFLKKAAETSWPASPYNGAALSWKTWKKDLANAVGGA